MKRHMDNVGFWLLVALIGATLVFMLFPLIVAVGMSFDARAFLGPFPPKEFSLQWFERFFADDFYINGLKTSLTLGVISTFISTTVGVTAAIVLDRYEFRGKQTLEAMFLSPLMVPAVVIGFALLLFFALIGVFDGFWRLLGGHIIITIPYTVRTTLAGLVGIRKTLTEAALILGANERQAFRDITLPLARTGIVAGGIFAFAFSMDEVAMSMFLTSPESYTLPVAMVSMMRTQFDLTIAAAAVLLMVLTIALILLLDWVLGIDKVLGQGMYRN